MLEEHDQAWFGDRQRVMLRPPEEVSWLRQELGLRRAYRDPALFSDGKVYADSLHRLHSCGMVKRCGEAPDGAALLQSGLRLRGVLP